MKVLGSSFTIAVIIWFDLIHVNALITKGSSNTVRNRQQCRASYPKRMVNEFPHNKNSEPLLCASTSAESAVNDVTVRAISKLLATCGIGIWASKAKLLDRTALSVLSKLVFGLFQPCLLFSNVLLTVSKSQSSGNGAAILFFPLAAATQIIIGYTVGKFMSRLLYGTVQSEESKQLLACTTFGNSGPLPLVFADALLKMHADQSVLPKSVGYISLYLLGWSPLFWIFAPAILSPDRKPEEGQSFDYQALFQRVLSPPVVSSILGALVGAIPMLRKQFIDVGGFLNPVFEAIKFIGVGYLPLVLLVLAGSLSEVDNKSGAEELKQDINKETDSKPAIALAKQVIGICFARFLLMPSIGFYIVTTAKTIFPALASLFVDPILVLVFLLETCMPSAQNSTVILQLQGNRKAASKMAKVLVLVYVLGIPAISYWLVKILALTKLIS